MSRRAPEVTQDFTPTTTRILERLPTKISFATQASVIVRFCYNAGRFERDGKFCCLEKPECRVLKN
jgi:hypothetical protein